MDFTDDLKVLHKQGKLVEIFTDKYNPDRFCLGFINSLNSTHVFINAVDYYGEEDGITVRRLNDIYRIVYDGEYETRIQKLFNIKKQSFKNYPTFSDIDMLLSAVRLSHFIVTIVTGNFEEVLAVSGVVEKAVSNKVFINEIGEDGSTQGSIILNSDDILSISYNSKDEKTIQLLLESSIQNKKE